MNKTIKEMAEANQRQAKSDFEHTLNLIQAEADTLYRLTRTLEPGLQSWCLMVGESLSRLASYRYVQSQSGQ